jgi:hypothetical protein
LDTVHAALPRLHVAFLPPQASQPVGALKASYEHADRLARRGYPGYPHTSLPAWVRHPWAAMARTMSVPWPFIVSNESVQHLEEIVAKRCCHRIPCVIDTAAFSLDIPVDSPERQLVGFSACPEQAMQTREAVIRLLADASLRLSIARARADSVGCREPNDATDAFATVLHTVTKAGTTTTLCPGDTDDLR